MPYKQYQNISSIAGNYDAFIVDLWGVIHDGLEIYDGVIECLTKLLHQNKKIIFLSNAPRRSLKAKLGLDRLNITPDLYDHIITSGEVTFEYIQAGKHNLGNKFIILGPDRDDDLLNGLNDYQMVKDPALANFVIATGFDNDSSTLEELIPELENFRKYNLPLLCANPDLLVVRKDGTPALCAGVIADYYLSIGGNIKSFGKPYKNVYEKSLALLPNIPLTKIAAIGDNLATDIKGANNMAIDSYLIAGGILGKELEISHGQLPDADKLLKICSKVDIIPKAVLPAFVW